MRNKYIVFHSVVGVLGDNQSKININTYCKHSQGYNYLLQTYAITTSFRLISLFRCSNFLYFKINPPDYSKMSNVFNDFVMIFPLADWDHRK